MRIAAIAVIGLLLLAGSASPSEVTNVEVSYQDGATVARIDVQGPIRFTHTTEVPKDGRPDRVIVDVLSATHELGAKEFLQLPPCPITGVRTSQFSVTPEKIVRVVFDLTGSPLYQIDADNKSIVINFSNKAAKSFKTWSTAAVVAAAKSQAKPALAAKPVASPAAKPAPMKAAQQNKVIENDRLASLAVEMSAPKPAAKASQPEPEKAPLKTTDRSFSGKTFSEKPAVVTPKPAPVQTAATETKAKAETPVKKVEAPAKSAPKTEAKTDAPKPTPAKTTVEKPAPKASQPVPSPVPASKAKDKANLASSPNPAPKPAAQSQQALAQKVGGKTATDPAPAKIASKETPAAKAAKPEPRPTARFRRQVPSEKIRGTMVAEFPKRLVIKYKEGGRRDPFGSLVDETRTYNDPIEARVPNVEGLKLVGILDSDGSNNRALFEDKSGFSYMLKTGDKVRNGYVLRVEADQVYFQIFEYGWSRTVALTME